MTRDEAIRRAKEVAVAEGWPWREPVRASLSRRWWIGYGEWEVLTNADHRGMNVRVLLDDRDGTVRGRYFLPR